MKNMQELFKASRNFEALSGLLPMIWSYKASLTVLQTLQRSQENEGFKANIPDYIGVKFSLVRLNVPFEFSSKCPKSLEDSGGKERGIFPPFLLTIECRRLQGKGGKYFPMFSNLRV